MRLSTGNDASTDTLNQRSAPGMADHTSVTWDPLEAADTSVKHEPGVGTAGATNTPRTNLPLHSATNDGGFGATLLVTSVWFVTIASVFSILLNVIWEFPGSEGRIPTWWDEWKAVTAPLAGVIITLVLACLFAVWRGKYTEPSRVDPVIFGELRSRFTTLDALLHSLCPAEGPVLCECNTPYTCRAGCDEARARRDFIEAEFGSHGARWVFGSGYVDLYRHLHAAEAALFLVQPSADVVANALLDSSRLDGAAAIPNWKTLRTNLHQALPLVGGSQAQQLARSGAEDGQEPAPAAPPTSDDQAVGRAILRGIRQTISDFRDGERAGLVRARNQLAWTGTITALAGYGLLILAMIRGVKPEIVSTGFAYYIVGATVGLFNELRTDSKQLAGDEDFGFHRARIFYVPVLSGLAAVGGVLVVALLYSAVDIGVGAHGAPAPDGDRPLSDFFNVQVFPMGLVIAAVFGLTPELLVEQLQHKADEFRRGLRNTSPIASGSEAQA